MPTRLWRFSVLDRVFFRDGRPFNMGEMTWQESQFPPSGRTLQGAIRAAVLEGLDADFKDFAAGQPCYRDDQGQRRDLKDMLGDASSLGRLTLTGPFLTKNQHLLYPAPLDLVHAKEGGFNLLCVREDALIECDLEQVILPRAASAGVKTQEGKYLTAAAMHRYLRGDVRDIRLPNACEDSAATLWPLRAARRDAPGLADLEPKMGLEREDDTRTAKDSMLYSVAFVRLRPGVGLAGLVQGLDSQLEPPAGWLQHLGGEGKLATLSITDAEPLPWPAIPALTADDRGLRFKLVLTTPALFDDKGTTWHPVGFAEAQPSGGPKHWSGKIEGTGATFDIVSACIGKRIRIGGWDIQNKNPHPLTAYVPAASVYFCRASEGERVNIEKLHGSKIGRKTEYGFGHIALNERKTTTGDGGNLWYEETLPPETVLYALLLAHKPRYKPQAAIASGAAEVGADTLASGGSAAPQSWPKDAPGVISEIDKLLNGQYVQIGGNETVGHGWCQIALTPGQPS